jgi:acetylornithine deacetylase/succinyl-diaminopimelate desuccinylase-like protein
MTDSRRRSAKTILRKVALLQTFGSITSCCAYLACEYLDLENLLLLMLPLIRKEFVQRRVLETLKDYIRIPNQSPTFDPHFLTNGYQEKAVELLTTWVKAQAIPNLKMEVLTLPQRTPLIFMEIPAFKTKSTKQTLLYGHFDKQPPLAEGGWTEGSGPYTPFVSPNGIKLYGRGGADDGYAIFASILSIAALQKAGKPHPKIFILIEGSEESGSRDLPAYMNLIRHRLLEISLVVCLDSGAGNYDQLWITSSLRGIVVADVTVSVLTEGVHSGDASGVVPSSFRIARNLLSRLEDEKTGEIVLPQLHCSKQEEEFFFEKARQAGRLLGEAGMVKCFPLLCDPVDNKYDQLALNRWWKPQLEIIGGSGFPLPSDAGNVLRPQTTLTLSLRLPPTVDKDVAVSALEQILSTVLPYRAQVKFVVQKASQGWSAPPCAPWLAKSLQLASRANFEGMDAVFQGEGGSIPFMAMLGQMLPQAQFMVCGVLGPNSNAHGPNEFLHLDYCQRIMACVADVLTDSVSTTDEEDLSSPAKMAKFEEEDMTKEFNRNADGTKI